jgi:hypothetical protein
MLTTDAIQKTYLFATGKTTTLTSSSRKYSKILTLLDTAQQDWFNEPGVVWNSRRVIATLDSTISTESSYELIDTDTGEAVNYISDFEGDPIIVTHTDGTTTEYTTVPPDQLQNRGSHNVCAIYGGNLVFPEAFTATSPQYGGTITVPSYQVPDELEATASEELVVDNPLFACYAAAAEYVRPDLVLGAQYGNLIAKAKPLMDRMLQENVSQNEETYISGVATLAGETW